MMEMLENYCAKLGYTRLHLRTSPRTPRLYQRLGYIFTDVRPVIMGSGVSWRCEFYSSSENIGETSSTEVVWVRRSYCFINIMMKSNQIILRATIQMSEREIITIIHLSNFIIQIAKTFLFNPYFQILGDTIPVPLSIAYPGLEDFHTPYDGCAHLSREKLLPSMIMPSGSGFDSNIDSLSINGKSPLQIGSQVSGTVEVPPPTDVFDVPSWSVDAAGHCHLAKVIAVVTQ